jgi:hypothetical protein
MALEFGEDHFPLEGFDTLRERAGMLSERRNRLL